jgi:hypothetical protein
MGKEVMLDTAAATEINELLQTSVRRTPPVITGNTMPVKLLRAQQIMGRNYVPMLDIDGVARGIINLNSTFFEQILTTKGRLISESELIKSRNTHVLILVPQVSILQLRDEFARRYTTPIFKNQTWYEQEDFAHDQGRAGWHLVRKNLLGVDIHPGWDVQRSLLPEDETTPTIRVMAYTMARFFLATGERLAADAFARCSSFDKDGYRGKVGYFGREGFSIAQGSCSESPFSVSLNKMRRKKRPDSHQVCHGNIGLAAEKKQI